MDILVIRMDDIVGAMNDLVLIEARAIRESDKTAGGGDVEQAADDSQPLLEAIALPMGEAFLELASLVSSQ